MGFCTACGRPRGGSERYCTGCGASLPEVMSVPGPVSPLGASGPGGVPGPGRESGSGRLESEQTVAAPVRQWPGHQMDPPGGAGPLGSARRSRAMIAVVSAAVVVVIAAVVVIAIRLTGSTGPTGLSATSPTLSSTPASTPTPTPTATPTPSSGTPAPSTSALTEATAVSNLLSAGVASRSALVTAVNDVTQCMNLTGAVSQIQQSANDRQTELNAANGLSADALQNGSTLKSYLIQALQHSLDADDEYLSWAQQEAASCQFESQPAIPDNIPSTRYKNLFVGLWNPIAIQYGLPTASASTM